MTRKKVLVTGMGGCIGGALLRHLAHKYDFTALNRHPMEGVRCVSADIRDFDSIRPHFEAQDAVVHLAASLAADAMSKDIIDSNVSGALNVFEAARQAGVKRVVFASSGAVILNYVLDSPWRELESGEYDKLPPSWPMINHESPVRPNGLYACSKVWGEAVGRWYADSYGISVICIRFGWIPETDRPDSMRSYAVWCSQRDAAQMVDKCISAADSLSFDIFYAVSNNKYNYRDIGHARDVIGFEPQDDPELYRQGHLS